MQYGPMLKPVIESTITRTIRSATDRTANLSLQAYYASEQTRILCITILSILLGNDTTVLPGIITQSRKQARQNLKLHVEDTVDAEEGKE